MSDRQWWAQKGYIKAGPHVSRERAAQALFTQLPKLKDAMTGYGTFGPYFDIQWIEREKNNDAKTRR